MSDFDLNDVEVLEVVLPGSMDGFRVDRALAMLTGLSRAAVSSMIEGGLVSIDGTPSLKASVKIEAGQLLVATLPAPDTGFVTPDASVPLDVVVEDPHFIVVNKRPGQVVHPGAGQRDGTLVAGFLARYPEAQALADSGVCEGLRPGVVHRLDKGTSGVMMMARTEHGFRALSEQLGERSVERYYLGLVEGHVTEERGVVDAPIGRSTRTPTMMAIRSDGRFARTGYEVLARLEKPQATLLRLRLETGRTHQIRVHLSSIGHPIVNDGRYGHRRDKRLEEDRFFLHSSTLTFTHPSTGKEVHASAPLPNELQALLPEGATY